MWQASNPLLTREQLEQTLADRKININYQLAKNRMPYVWQCKKRMYFLPDVMDWLLTYQVAKEWGTLDFLRVVGIQDIEVIPKVFHRQPIWRLLLFTELFGSPIKMRSDAPIIKGLFEADWDGIFKLCLTKIQQNVIQSRIRYDEIKTVFNHDNKDITSRSMADIEKHFSMVNPWPYYRSAISRLRDVLNIVTTARFSIKRKIETRRGNCVFFKELHRISERVAA